MFAERSDITATGPDLCKPQFSLCDANPRLYANEDRLKNDESIVNNYIKMDRMRNKPHEEVSSVTGLRKTNYSETLYGDKKTALSKVEKTHTRNSSSPPIILDSNDSPSKSLQKSATSSKIPQSPVLTRRRMSVENLSPHTRSRSSSFEKLPRNEISSPKKNNTAQKTSKDPTKPPTVPANSPTGVNGGSFGKVSGAKAAQSTPNNTWNGRTPSAKGKSRAAVSNDTFVSPSQKANNKTASPQFQRNSNLRSSTTAIRNMPGYDHNGRKIKSPPQTSPNKTSKQMSPLLEKILKSAENVDDDLLVLETVKGIINQYSGSLQGIDKSGADDSKYYSLNQPWNYSNGERSHSSLQMRDNDDGSTSSSENDSGLKSAALVNKIPMFTPRKDPKAGVTSRIPAPVSAFKKATELYY